MESYLSLYSCEESGLCLIMEDIRVYGWQSRSPVLSSDCLHNRDAVISLLQPVLRNGEKKIEKITPRRLAAGLITADTWILPV